MCRGPEAAGSLLYLSETGRRPVWLEPSEARVQKKKIRLQKLSSV